MRRSIVSIVIAALSPVRGLVFNGPAPTHIRPERVVAHPEPTPGPHSNELRNRQANLNPATCGWIDGDWSSVVSCSAGRTCMLYTSSSIGMAGCCAGSDTQVCGWNSRCVDYSAYAAGRCGAECLANEFVRKCTDRSQPYCVTSTYPGNGVADYGCDSTSKNTVYTVRQRATDGAGGTTSIRLPILSGSAVTGYKNGSATTSGSSRTSRYAPTGGYTDGSTNSGTRGRVRRIGVGLIIGIVVAALAVVFFLVIGVCMCVKKKRKQRQLAADAQTVAAMQANRPQSMYPSPPQQMQPGPPPAQQQGEYVPQQPNPNGYFAPPLSPGQDPKYNPHHPMYEYSASQLSNSVSPPPGQPHAGSDQSAPSPMLSQTAAFVNHQNPVEGAQEADSVGVGRPAVSPAGQYQNPGAVAHEVDAGSTPQVPVSGRPVYEMGEAR